MENLGGDAVEEAIAVVESGVSLFLMYNNIIMHFRVLVYGKSLLKALEFGR